MEIATHVHYISIQFIAVMIYLFLLCCFIGKVKDQSVKRLRDYLFSCVLWVGGSLLMRLQVFPGIHHWFHTSLIGFLLLICCIMNLTLTFLGRYRKRYAFTFFAFFGVLETVNVLTGAILPPPEVEYVNDCVHYIYHVNHNLAWGLIPLILFVLFFLRKLLIVRREQPDRIKKLHLFIVGLVVIVAGSIIRLIPGVYFPIDMTCGLVAAILLVVSLYQRRLFVLSERMTFGVIYMVGLILSFLPLFFVDSLPASVSEDNRHTAFIVYVCLMNVWILIVFSIAAILQARVNSRRELESQKIISNFQKKVNSSLDITYISTTLLESILELTNLSGALIDLYQVNGRDYTFGLGSLSGSTVERNSTPAFLEFVMQQRECFFAKDGVNMEEFSKVKGMKNWLAERNFGGLGCLKNESELLGYLFITEDSQHAISKEREQQLSVMCYSATSALRNAALYQKLYNESITDQLTGLYNRNYIHLRLAELEADRRPAGILHLDIDGFRLYNEMYGTAEGDRLLEWVGELIQSILPRDARLCRYGTDEYVALFRNNDIDTIASLGRQVIEVLSDETRLSEKHVHYITMSGGVSAFPLLAESTEEALRQAKQSTALVKAHGRNQVYIYNHDVADSSDDSYEKVAPTIYALTAAIDAKDSFTFVHVQNVEKYAIALAKAIGYSNENCEIIRQAALLHDVGKISIPEYILKKTGKLTDEEYNIMKKHVANSIDIIQFLPGMDYVIPAVIGHHERFDGKGYPRGIAGTDIPESARILAIADSFDAMTARRSYKEARSVEYAIEELKRCKGTQFDPYLADVFIDLLERKEVEISEPL